MSAVAPAVPRVDVVHLRNEQASGTSGGTATAGSFAPVVLNTKAQDTGSICTLASNQFSLPAGTYEIQAFQQFQLVNQVLLRLRNVTDSATTIIGQTTYNAVPAGVVDMLSLTGRFTITATKTFELQYWCSATAAGNGLGNTFAAPGVVNAYCDVFISKVA